MTDEQLGREWCRRNGKRPEVVKEDSYYWRPDDGSWMFSDPSHLLPAGAYPMRVTSMTSVRTYPTEGDAYAAVGAALRAVERLGAEVRAILGEVSQ